jgi:hypothetical protein
MTTEAVSARSRKSIQQELVPSKRSNRTNENLEARDQRALERRDNKKGKGTKNPSTTPPASTEPVSPPTPIQEPTGTRSLAERYVAQYEAQSGRTLTTEQRAAKVGEVEEFYSEPGRTGRLEKVVFA